MRRGHETLNGNHDYILAFSTDDGHFIHTENWWEAQEYCEFLAMLVADAIEYRVSSLRMGSPYTFSPLLTDYEYLKSTWTLGGIELDKVAMDLSYLHGFLNQKFVEELGHSAQVVRVSVTNMQVVFVFGRGYM